MNFQQTCMKILPIITSSASLKTVLNITVTRSFCALTYLKKYVSYATSLEDKKYENYGRNKQGFVVSVVDDCALST